MSEMVKVERKQAIGFTANVPLSSGGVKKWEWQPSRNNKPYVLTITRDAYNWIVQNSTSFETGELRLADAQENIEELKFEINNIEEYEKNAHSREEVMELLKKGNLPKLKKFLSEITSQTERRFVLDVMRDIKADLINSKVELVEEWYVTKPTEAD